MFFGPQPATLLRLQPLDIHGTRMLDIFFRLDGEAEARSTRLGQEALEGDPMPGDSIIVHFLMQTVTRIERRTP